MEKTRYTESRIIKVLHEVEDGNHNRVFLSSTGTEKG
jgi:hypothetical protein